MLAEKLANSCECKISKPGFNLLGKYLTQTSSRVSGIIFYRKSWISQTWISVWSLWWHQEGVDQKVCHINAWSEIWNWYGGYGPHIWHAVVLDVWRRKILGNIRVLKLCVPVWITGECILKTIFHVHLLDCWIVCKQVFCICGLALVSTKGCFCDICNTSDIYLPRGYLNSFFIQSLEN